MNFVNIKLKLIDEWKQAYKLTSVWLGTAVTVLAGLQAYLPDMVTFLPAHWVPYATGAIVLARMIKFSMETVKAKNDKPSN